MISFSFPNAGGELPAAGSLQALAPLFREWMQTGVVWNLRPPTLFFLAESPLFPVLRLNYIMVE